ncbi:S66 peptidase family protein [Clostridium septicum]|uniref:LD-carboxypeptidase n=1 Tax=Clostridium septicum TaxID=1504 RepID=A0A9N7JL63_CLOSE|nr:LD-carboxypeptidase [Clostridium septicum]AYE34493.1 LD-carboxypeptidase [Clostridium septicum]MDU1315051.1 LD-carboxypeptidase [Clostridium septicum]QAS59895.1 LD-carboxypeptidase [Clostridium septicum]UEC20865.1 LD-carboxypeptidase [Clostridium septicum]USS01085.1 LD-carboxypeptidase [Clostridium septicum]
MLKLNPLSPSSTIGIVAPASAEDPNIIDKKILEFEELGFNVKKGKHIYDKYGYLAGTDSNRAEDLMDMFIDNSIDAILCLRGGYGSMRMIPYLNLKTIKQNPKPFCGYSDITLLLNYISKKCNFATFHAPMITSNFKDSVTQDYFINTLTNHNMNFYNLKKISNNKITYINKNNFNGKLVGGNLSIICSSIGTPYELNFKNSIVLIEEIDESPYAIDRMLTQLIYSGKLKHSSGIILGDFTNCTSKNKNSAEFNIDEVINQKLSQLKIPVIKGFPIGHSYPNVTLPIGSKLSFNYKNDLLNISENIFKNSK